MEIERFPNKRGDKKRTCTKKLWNFSLIGDSYYFILNHYTLSFEFVSKEIESIMGYLPLEFDVRFMNDKLHPDDCTWFLSLGERLIDFFPLFHLIN